VRVAPLVVVTTTVTVYVFEGVPTVGPTTPGFVDPPAQPDMNAKINKLAVTKIHERRRRRAAMEKSRNAASSRSNCKMARSGARLRGERPGTGKMVECDGAVVVTIIVSMTGALSVNELEDGEQVPAGIVPLQETVTVSLNPPEGESKSGNVAGCPAEIVAEVEPPGGTEMMTSVPSPDRVMDCGLAGALSEIVMAPARGPVAVGVKVTEMVQVAFLATPVPQVSVSAKSPLALMLVNISVVLPTLVTVTLCLPLVEPTNWFPKGTAVAERLMAGPNGVPEPMRVTDCGLSPALSMMTREPTRVPVAVGVNVTLMEQDALAARVAGQVEAVKSPVAVTPAMFNVSLPELVSVTT
jgi:hypothetical protein